MQHDVALLMHLRSFKVLQVEPFIAFFLSESLQITYSVRNSHRQCFFSHSLALGNHDMERTYLGTHYTLDTLIKDH